MHFRFPYIGANLCKSSLQPGISEHCDTTDTGWRLVYHVVCLFTPQLLPGTSSSLTTEEGLRLNRPGCLVLYRGGLPVQIWSPTQALTGPSVE